MKKRLVIVIWNMGIGGIQKRMRDVVTDISKHHKDWEVYFLIRRRVPSSFLTPLESHDRIHITYYPFQTAVRFPLGFVLWTAIQYLRLRPQVVLTFLAQLTAVMAIIRTLIFWQKSKLVINEGAYISGYLKYNNMEYFRSILRLAYRAAERIIVPTVVCKHDLVHSFSVPEDRVTVIPNWTLLSSVKKMKPVYDCVFIGRFEHEKNPFAVIDIMKKVVKLHPDARCAMVGSGKLQQQLKERVIKSGLTTHIDILSFTVGAYVVLRRSRILLVPSFNEGMPNVVLEAAMCTVPTVANNFKGSSEVILNGKTGYIAENENGMAAKVLLLLNTPTLLKQLGIQAKQRTVEHFHYERQKEFISLLLSDN